MQNPKNLNPASIFDVATTRAWCHHRAVAFWHTMIGKKVVMAITGIVLIGFVIAHMLGNLKIFAGPETINAYSRFLREVGMPELELWPTALGRANLLLACVALHITAAVQLSRMSWAARPIGYGSKTRHRDDLGRANDALGRSSPGCLHCFPSFPSDGRLVGFRHGAIQGSRRLPERGGRVRGLADRSFLHHRDGRTVPAPRPRNLEHAANSRLEHCSKRSDAKDHFARHRDRRVPGFTSVPVAVIAGWMR